MATRPNNDDDPDTGLLLQEEFTRRFSEADLKGAIDNAETVVRVPRVDPDAAVNGERATSEEGDKAEPGPSADPAAAWIEEALKNASTVVRKVDDADTLLRTEVDELPRPPRTNSGEAPAPSPREDAPVQKTSLAAAPSANAPTQRMPVVSAEVRHDPSVTDRDARDNTLSRALPVSASDPGWLAVQSSLAGLAVSAVLGMVVLSGFWFLR